MQIFEYENTEFKQEYVKDIRKEVVAFANSEGGTVLIGIRKDGEVIGVENPDEVMLQTVNLLRDSIAPDSFSGSNLINIYEDRIEFVSLGGLVSGLELRSIFLGVSQSRNPNLVSVFYRMSLIESYGTGIAKIRRAYRNNNEKLVFETAQGVFRVTLPDRNESERISESGERQTA